MFFEIIDGLVSIHAPVRGGDFFEGLDGRPWCVSIHAPVRGGDIIYLIVK